MEHTTAEKMDWIKNLVESEQQMEEAGIVDMQAGFDPQKILIHSTIQFLLQLKTEFVDAASVFNELKNSALGRIKIYGIAKTHADFMLFRNGFKMIFSFKAPGQIGIKLNFIGNNFLPPTSQSPASETSNNLMEEQLIETQWGPFGEVLWTYQGKPFKQEYMIRYYLSLFLKESAK